MKQKISELYLKRCRVRLENSSSKYTTVAYKPGITSPTSVPRDIKNEFSKSQNAMSPVKYEIEVIPDLNIRGTESFIKDLENFILYDYFNGEENYFNNSQKEYIKSYDETAEKYKHLIQILNLKQDVIAKANDCYEELKDSQPSNIHSAHETYNKIKDEIKNTLIKIMNQRDPINSAVSNNTANAKNTTVNVNKNVDIYAALLRDFTLLKGTYKGSIHYMLMHNDHHKGKDPLQIDGSWKIPESNALKSKFQFHNLDLGAKYGKFYNQKNASLKKALAIFKNDVLDYDDPNFDKKKLPH